jgi:hypothetical protein
VANRDNLYEAAFEEFLRARRIPYVAVDEAKRTLLGDGSLKSLDFIVSPAEGISWLIDVKGRRFPTASGEGCQYWKNWSTRDDLRSLAAWQRLFGSGFRGNLYGFLGIALEEYAYYARPISLAWDTVAMPTARFRQIAVPVDRLFARSGLSAAESRELTA